MGPRLFSGWGVRTLAEGEGRYNPIGYHVGTVWPFDNSFIAWGLTALWFQTRKRRRSPPESSTLPHSSMVACRRHSEGIGASADEVPGPVSNGLQPTGLVDRDAHCFCSGQCSASSRSAITCGRPGPTCGIGHLELLEIPGRWGGWMRFGEDGSMSNSESANERNSAQFQKALRMVERTAKTRRAGGASATLVVTSTRSVQSAQSEVRVFP